MPTTNYHFITNWKVKAQKSEIAAIMNEPLTLPLWWPAVYLEIETEETGDETFYHLHTKGWLPYTIRWSFQRTVDQLPDYLELKAIGDLEGYGKWTFTQEGEFVNIHYDWEVVGNKPIFKYLAFILRPLFGFNHRWAMDRGLESLKLELERRRKGLNFGEGKRPPLAAFPHRHFYQENLNRFLSGTNEK